VASTQRGETGQETIGQQPATGETYRLTIEAKELTWIRMTAGQNSPQEMLLRPGERIEQSAPNFIIHIGNAGGIAVDFQGKTLGTLGRHGQVIHLKLP
jgi:cytoskeleton protein RodZ